MATSRTTPTTVAASALARLTDVRSRYELSGPHTTVVVPVPLPGTVGDDFDLRWKATKADLRHLGASESAIDHMDAIVASTARRGHSLLLTANDDSAASCWLSLEVEPVMTVGALPALIPVVWQLTTMTALTIAAAVDRIGGDIYSVDAFDVRQLTTVDGDDEQIHKAASGGGAGAWSQQRHQRHSEVVWERNAALVAAEIETQVSSLGADAILLSGDDRAVALVESHLAGSPVDAVAPTQAGGRHEPGTAERLRTAVLEERHERAAVEIAKDVQRLREELGQNDRAIDGSVHVLEALGENRVGTLFVDAVEGRLVDNVDALIRSALAHGARIVITPELDVRDGIAAHLRVPYQ